MSITNTFHIDHVVAFKTMLTDSKIIGQFTLDETKVGYSITHGYFITHILLLVCHILTMGC